MGLVRSGRDSYRVVSPEEYLRGDGWAAWAPDDGTGAPDDWSRPAPAGRTVRPGPGRRRMRPWLLVSAGGLGFTGGLLAVFLQLRTGTGPRPLASPPQRAESSPGVPSGRQVLRPPHPLTPARPGYPTRRPGLGARIASSAVPEPRPRSKVPRSPSEALAAPRSFRPPPADVSSEPAHSAASKSEFGFEG